MTIIPFSHYVRLYTLHWVERPPDALGLYVRIQVLHYSFAPLAGLPVDAAYADDAHAGVSIVQQSVLPRLQTLLDSPEPLLLEGGESLWRRYAAQRGLPADTVPIPTIHAPQRVPRLPARSQTADRIARIQRGMELFQTVVETASTLAALWQNWQIGREQRRLLETQRLLLHDAIQAQLEGQGRALDHALDRDFVRGYLAEHAGDAVFDDTVS
jgi:hypothetical protein